MSIPRALIYAEKENIDEFGIQDESSLNHLIYKWIHSRKEIFPGNAGFGNRKLEVFNDAYYICTVIQSVPKPEDWLSYYKRELKLPSIVLPMVYCYISKFKDKTLALSTLLMSIETYASEDSVTHMNLKDIIQYTTGWNESFPTSVFNLRNLTPDMLSTLDWEKITEGFKKDKIELIVRNFAKSEDEQKMLGEAIENAAHKAEDEFYSPSPSPEDFPDDDWDSPSNDDGFGTPDYSEAYSICGQLKQGDVFLGKKRKSLADDDYMAIAQLKERIKVLEEEKKQLNETIEALNTNMGNIDVAAKVGLELIVKLMINDGANLEMYGNKVVCTKALMMMTGRSESSCKSIHSDGLRRTNPQHRTKIQELNRLLEQLGMETRL